MECLINAQTGTAVLRGPEVFKGKKYSSIHFKYGYKIPVTACAELFWGYWSSYLLIFRDNWSLKPSIHIHVDLHAHTGFAVGAAAGSEPEELHFSAQPPCCWVECRFNRLTLMFGENVAASGTHAVGCIEGVWNFRQTLQSKHGVARSNRWVLYPGLPL